MMTSPMPYRVFGLPMQRRSSRRRLVVWTYAALTLAGIGTYFLCTYSSGWMFSLVIYATCAVSIYIFGGQGRHGLVKSFLNTPPPPEAPGMASVSLQLNPPPVIPAVESNWRNDERELAQRDRAHYQAFNPLQLLFLLVLLFSAWALHPPRFVSLEVVQRLLLIVGIAGVVLSITLPAALILWNEPDMLLELEEVSR